MGITPNCIPRHCRHLLSIHHLPHLPFFSCYILFVYPGCRLPTHFPSKTALVGVALAGFRTAGWKKKRESRPAPTRPLVQNAPGLGLLTGVHLCVLLLLFVCQVLCPCTAWVRKFRGTDQGPLPWADPVSVALFSLSVLSFVLRVSRFWLVFSFVHAW